MNDEILKIACRMADEFRRATGRVPDLGEWFDEIMDAAREEYNRGTLEI